MKNLFSLANDTNHSSQERQERERILDDIDSSDENVGDSSEEVDYIDHEELTQILNDFQPSFHIMPIINGGLVLICFCLGLFLYYKGKQWTLSKLGEVTSKATNVARNLISGQL